MEESFDHRFSVGIGSFLACSSDHVEAVKTQSIAVCEKVKGTPNVSVARVLFGRTFLKGYSFIDTTVFVNKSPLALLNQMDVEDTLKMFLGELTNIPGFEPKPGNAISGKRLLFTLPVTYDNVTMPVVFELVVANNVEDDQVPSTFVEVGDWRLLNPYTATIHWNGQRETVALVKELSNVTTREVVRVAKMWDKTLHKYDPNFSGPPGRSYMIELIAIAACKEGTAITTNDKRFDGSVLHGFARFLVKMSEFENLIVVFTENYSFEQIPVYVSGFGSQRPLVMDPLNRYYNVAQGIDKESARKYETYARESRRTLRDFEMQNYPLTAHNFHKVMGFSDESFDLWQ